MLFDDVYGFDQEFAKRKSKAEFVAEFQDHAHIYPNLKKVEKAAQLETIWKKLRNEPEEVMVEAPVVEIVAKEKPGK